MDTLSHTDASLLSKLSVLKGDADIDCITNLLLGLEDLGEGKDFPSVFENLKDLKLLEIKKIKLFNKFIANTIITNNYVDFSGTDFIMKMDVSTPLSKLTNLPQNCHAELVSASNKIPKQVRDDSSGGLDAEFRKRPTKKIISFFKKNKIKHSKYEVRFFWPSNLYPEVYDLCGLIFNEEYYTHLLTTDKYILTNNSCNIKIRENELQIKTCVKTINNISQFIKKKRIDFPLKSKKLNGILNQKMISDSERFSTAEDLMRNLSNSPDTSCVEVIKERYVRKMADHTKIEFSLIKIQQKEWKTICIESKNLEKVLALSLLINQENAEKLSYDEFLCKYA